MPEACFKPTLAEKGERLHAGFNNIHCTTKPCTDHCSFNLESLCTGSDHALKKLRHLYSANCRTPRRCHFIFELSGVFSCKKIPLVANFECQELTLIQFKKI